MALTGYLLAALDGPVGDVVAALPASERSGQVHRPGRLTGCAPDLLADGLLLLLRLGNAGQSRACAAPGKSRPASRLRYAWEN